MIGLLIQKVLLVVWRIAAVRIKVIAYMDTATINEIQSIKQRNDAHRGAIRP